MSKTLHLNLMRKWFDLILSGEKKEEYRDIKETILRLLFDKEKMTAKRALCFCNLMKIKSIKTQNKSIGFFTYNGKRFDTITFSNGYRKDRRQFTIELNSIKIDTGRSDWGAEKGEFYIVIELGEVLSKNC